MIKKFILGLAMVTMLSSCIAGADVGSTVTETALPDGVVQTVTTNANNSDTGRYFDAYEKHSSSESARVVGMVNGVMGNTDCEDCTEEGKGWAGAFKVMAIAYGENFKPQPFTGDRPLNGYDVMDGAVDDVVGIVNRVLNPFGVYDDTGGSGGSTIIKATDQGSVNVDMSNTNDSHNVPTAYDNSYNTHEQDYQATADSYNSSVPATVTP